jgi:hypothetical protein
MLRKIYFKVVFIILRVRADINEIMQITDPTEGF